ncbi:MAG: prohibitin family protein [Candidatus Hydrogenedentota bacterium]
MFFRGGNKTMLFVLSFIVGVVMVIAYVATRKDPRAKGSGVLLLLAVIAFLFCFSQSLTVIPAGHVGVVDFFGIVSNKTLKAGINIVNPLARIIKFSIKTQEIKEVMEVPSKEGLNIHLEVSVLFHLNPEKAAEVYKTVGTNYIDIILVPQFRSVTRGVTAGYEAKALYTSEREMLSQLISTELQKIVEKRGIIIETSPLRKVGLPPGLSQSIEEKLRAEQESQRMEFILMKEKQEADRKRIEAQGIADFQKIVSAGISEQLLKWKGIEATEKLANSANSKIVIVGSGKDGLPIILNTD